MNRHRVIRAGAGLAAILAVGLFASGCTKYATEADMQALDTQKQAALSAEEKVQDLDATRTDFAKQITERSAEFQEVKAERIAIRQRLIQQGAKLSPLKEGEVMPAPAEMKQMEAPEETKEPMKAGQPMQQPAQETQPDSSAVTEPAPEKAPEEEIPELEQKEGEEIPEEVPEQEKKEEVEDLFGYASFRGVER
ncbi:MAG: hypothetical protein V2A56_00350 [bacterium]